MDIRFGKCTAVNGARIGVTIPGLSGDAGFECLLLQPCALGPSVWMPPAVGDVVVIALDEERLENSVVLGVVYPDAKTPPKTGRNQAAVTFSEVYLGNPTPDTKSPRDDRLQSQLSAIKSALDSLVSVFNSHNHTVATVSAADAAAIVEAAATVSIATTSMQTGSPQPLQQNSYSVGETASDCVWAR